MTYAETVQVRQCASMALAGGNPDGVYGAGCRAARRLALQAAERRLGWRVYGTDRPATALTLEQAVLAYRNEYLVERGFGRLKGVA